MNKISKDYILAWINNKDDLADILSMLVNGEYTIEQFKHDIRLYVE